MAKYLDSNLDLSSPALADTLDELPLWSAPFGLKLLDMVIYRKGISALDIGYGNGFPLTELAMRLGSDSRVYGIDPWQAATQRTMRKMAQYGIENISLLDGVAEQMPLENNSIDLIVSNNGINNVADQGRVIAECSRVAKRGCQLLLTVNTPDTMMEFYAALSDVLSEMGEQRLLPKIQSHIQSKRKPLDFYKDALGSNGFEIQGVEHAQFQYRFSDGTAMLNHFFIRLAFLPAWKDLVPVGLHAEVFGEVERRLNQRAHEDGYLPLTVPFVGVDARKL